MIVNAGWLQSRRFAIPADQVYAYRDTHDLDVNLSKSEVEALPPFDDAGLTPRRRLQIMSATIKTPGVPTAHFTTGMRFWYRCTMAAFRQPDN